MTVSGLTKLHMLPTGQTLTSEYYFNQSLEKEVKPFIASRRQVTGGLIERKLFSSKKGMTIVQNGAPGRLTLQRKLRRGVKEFAKLYSRGTIKNKLYSQRTLLIAIPLKTSGVSLTRQHTKIQQPKR